MRCSCGQMLDNLHMLGARLVLRQACPIGSLSGFQDLPCVCSPSLARPALPPGWTSRKAPNSCQRSLKLAVPSPRVSYHLGQLSHCLLGPLKLDYRRRENISYNRAVCPAWDTSAIFFLSLFLFITRIFLIIFTEGRGMDSRILSLE